MNKPISTPERRKESFVFILSVTLLLRAAPSAAFCTEADRLCENQAANAAFCEQNPQCTGAVCLDDDQCPFCCPHTDGCVAVGVPKCHREITEQGLSFLRPLLLERTVHTNLHMDNEHECVLWAHADGCDFENTGHNINDFYSSDVHSDFYLAPCPADGTHSDTRGVIGLLHPSDPRPTDAAAVFGYALHPIQDLYSHSNWVELTRGLTTPPLIEPSLNLWGTHRWTPLDAPEVVAHHPGVDAVVFADEDDFDGTDLDGDPPWQVTDWDSVPYFTSRIFTEGPTYLPVISGSTHGGALQEEECPDGLQTKHTHLNKDSTIMNTHYHGETEEDHVAAADLAIRQTAHEFCRLMHIATNVGIRDGYGFGATSVAMGFWVRPDGVPHPAGTPCASTAPGDVGLTVDVTEIKVLNDHDAGDDPGDLNFVLALYTQDLTRSARAEVNSLTVGSGEVVAAASAPGPVSLCLTESQANAAIATVQAWDDDPANGGVAGELNPDGDEAARGVSVPVGIGAQGLHTASSADLEVTFDVGPDTDSDGDGLLGCAESRLGTDPADSDSDDDGVQDGAEGDLGTDPLDPDTDGDEAMDGADNCPVNANADQADSDGDGLGDLCDPDADDDGVLNADDACAGTSPGDTVDAQGCSIAQLCPCSGPRGATRKWKNHGAYTECVESAATNFESQGLISSQQRARIIESASRSTCGK